MVITLRVSIREVTPNKQKMKPTLSAAVLLLAEANPTADVLPPMAQPRRYRDLDSMIAQLNPNFDPRKYWAYGCNCLVLGDRPMSDPGKVSLGFVFLKSNGSKKRAPRSTHSIQRAKSTRTVSSVRA